MTGFLGSGFIYAVESATRKYKPHLVVYLLASDSWVCGCPANRECRHIKAARKAHEAGAADRHPSRLSVVKP